MARIRTIKPEFPQSESMGRMSREARFLFVLLWTIADDEGRMRGNSRYLCGQLYPYDDDVRSSIDSWIDELVAEDCITRYSHDGSQYIQIKEWAKHQKIDRPTKSRFPDPPANPTYADSTDTREGSRGLDEGSTHPREDSTSIRRGLDEGSSLDLGPGPRTGTITTTDVVVCDQQDVGSPPPAEGSGIVIRLAKRNWELPLAKLKSYEKTYAGRFSVRDELAKAALWLEDNQNRRPKSVSSAGSFLTRWLNRADETANKQQPVRNGTQQRIARPLNVDELPNWNPVGVPD